MKINNKEYTIPELSFNAMCKLEDMGVNFADMEKKTLSTVRGFLALAMDGNLDKAGTELEKHLASGGNIEEVVTEIGKAVEKSGFFQALKSQ